MPSLSATCYISQFRIDDVIRISLTRSHQACPLQQDVGVDGVTDVLGGILLGVVVVVVVLRQQPVMKQLDE